METNLKYTEEWLSLARHGNFQLAEKLYFDKLFPEIIDKFQNRFSNLFDEDEVLISILGFSPEPIILTANAVKPIKHYIITTEHKDEVINRVEEFVQDEFNLITISDTSFNTIYKSLKEILYQIESPKITIDITGGKKSMVAAAAIFGKDYRCKITYVDFDDYIKELRKPVPGSEVLNVVYDPYINQPELFLK
ncbi:hypothetical protein [Gelidibacter pelagius]|uniref:CRISPR-associated protein (Cas_Cas02710) n=1 Tax=Gelidibacter pelagius TaxID=2819985 RepID=A0ABS3SQA8_9FLAO|nr:hypothetical protein [Gelidibacter pelagius]MBO3097849.1 hypothetical protein [Gelidibacter pelagius]